MDIKSKKYRTAVYICSTIVCVIALCVGLVTSVSLLMSYDLTGLFEKNYQVISAVISENWSILVISIAVAIIAFVVSLITVGKKDDDGRIKLNWFDKIFTDVQLVICGAAVIGLGGMTLMVHDLLLMSDWYTELVSVVPDLAEQGAYYMVGGGFEPVWVQELFTTLGILILMVLSVVLSQSLVKKIKARAFWKNTIIGKICCYIYDGTQASQDVFWKALVILIGGALLSATWFGLIPVLVLIFVFVPRMVRKYERIKEGVNQVKNGNLSYEIPIEGRGELDRLALSINEISEATNLAVQNELKNQRMKTDLISNVSHDLRTPLTSMITYVDLLKTEGLSSEQAPEYLRIVDEKTRRLRKLTEDLFEAAKASSGAIPVNMGKIEMTSIVNQALAELEEKLEENNLQVIFNQKVEETFVMADGQLLWRIIENLLINASKYALPGSRVYVDILEKGEDMILLEIKNISKDPLNISADELTERFKRGDEARNTEGSGLGLAIAKDLTRLMSGCFDLVVDGDLFKASVALFRTERVSE